MNVTAGVEELSSKALYALVSIKEILPEETTENFNVLDNETELDETLFICAECAKSVPDNSTIHVVNNFFIINSNDTSRVLTSLQKKQGEAKHT